MDGSSLTFNLESRLALDVERRGAQIGSGDNKVESIVVVLVKAERCRRIDTPRKSFDTVAQISAARRLDVI